MKQVIFASMLTVLAVPAMASDGSTWNYAAPGYAQNYGGYAVQSAPCGGACGAPIRVKVGTEVIDHYQVYQPVTVYQPAGMYSERRIVQAAPAPRCGRCANRY